MGSAGPRGLPGRRVPVAVCLAGLSPAVVTEALYALATRRPARVVPAEIHIVTTHGGYPEVVGKLLGPRGALARLREQYRLPRASLRCPPAHVHVLTRPDGRPIDDIRTPEDSRAAGEAIGALVRRLAADERVELHCSLAGGRKTMSALLATALQLHGRPGDRLYHVLVNEPFERIPEFMFPPRPPVRYRLGDRLVDSRRARIELAEIPFVRLGAAARRLGLDSLTLERIAAELEEEALGRLVPEPLVIRLTRREVRVGPRAIHLRPQEIALYAAYAEARGGCPRAACRAGDRCAGCQLTDDELHDRRGVLLRFYEATRPQTASRVIGILSGAGTDAHTLAAFREWLEQTRSRLNRALAGALGRGPRGARYLVTGMGAETEQRRRRGLALPPPYIRFDESGEGGGSPSLATGGGKPGAPGWEA